ncbi:MAG: hypothetical protein NT049_07065, partial [Planctomycetota bacterium]|nr:hypothetical protein [Planctomycetota bacterium]
ASDRLNETSNKKPPTRKGRGFFRAEKATLSFLRLGRQGGLAPATMAPFKAAGHCQCASLTAAGRRRAGVENSNTHKKTALAGLPQAFVFGRAVLAPALLQ